MNREEINERIKALQDEAKRLEAAHAQVSGALADCNYWLKRIAEEEYKAKSEESSNG